MESLGFVGIIAVVLLVWFLVSKVFNSKVGKAFGQSGEDMTLLATKWAHVAMADSATIGAMARAHEKHEKSEELKKDSITKESVAKIDKDWGI